METLLWLEKQSIECDGICFLKDKTLLCADYLVDDNDWNFLNSRVKHGILVTAPYNTDKDETDMLVDSNMNTITRVSSLHEFVDAYEDAVNSIEEAKKEYGIGGKKHHTLKSSIPYNFRGETLYFSREGEKVFIGDYFILGVNAYARVQLANAWPDCKVKVKDLNKYLK